MAVFPFSSAHVIGIGGVGMSATAKLLRDSGVRVTGSDEAVYPPISDVLREEKLDCRTPYAASNIPPDVECFVIGKNAKLVPQSNGEVAAAFATGRPVLSFAEALGILARGKQTIVAAGSFGKTTSVSMLVHLLGETGHDPSWMIGAAPLSPPSSAGLGAGPHFLLEGDEYPSSNTDDRSKFLHYHPSHLIVTPLAHDHVNVFPSIESYLAPFSQLVDMLPADGALFVSTSGDLSGRFLASHGRAHETFGIVSGGWHVRDVEWGERSSFTLVHKGRDVVRASTVQLGVHNIENMVGVGAFAISRGIVTPQEFAGAMGSFKGIRRRLDRKSERTRIPVFEGFGSSYDKARSAIAAMTLHFSDRRLIVVFEPHTFSWRNRSTMHWYDDVFDGAAKTFIWHPAQQGAATHGQVTQADIVARIAAADYEVEALGDAQSARDAIIASIDEDCAVLFLTSGNLGGLIESVPARLEELYPAEVTADAGSLS
ncbi:MAG: hypothetical protein FJX29_12845 [Alphaproteobacteria bacterium]|nr:hypothetical protein [Alphaproteobacteria bacterium]